MASRFALLLFSYLPLAAHFLRDGNMLLALAIGLMPLLALPRKKTLIYLLQTGLIVGVLFVWLPTAVEIAQIRIAMEQPWMRMAVILYGVVGFSLLSAFMAGQIRPET